MTLQTEPATIKPELLTETLFPESAKESRLTAAARLLAVSDLEKMPLHSRDLPKAQAGFRPNRDHQISNQDLASNGFASTTAQMLNDLGRRSGWIREFGAPAHQELQEGAVIKVATYVHLFVSPAAVVNWIDRQFVQLFQDQVGQPLNHGAQLIAATPYPVAGFYGYAAALHIIQGGEAGILSVSAIDLQFEQLLGAAVIASIGEKPDMDTAVAVARSLERSIVNVMLS